MPHDSASRYGVSMKPQYLAILGGILAIVGLWFIARTDDPSPMLAVALIVGAVALIVVAVRQAKRA